MGSCKGLKGNALAQCLALEKNVKKSMAARKKNDSTVNAKMTARKRQANKKK